MILLNFKFNQFFLLLSISIWGVCFNKFIGGEWEESIILSGIFSSFLFWFYFIEAFIHQYNKYKDISFRTLLFLIFSSIFLIILNSISAKFIIFFSILFFIFFLILFFKKKFKFKNFRKYFVRFFLLSTLINLILFFFYLTILEPTQIFFPFIERFALTGAHLDILFHSSIVNGIKNYNFYGSMTNGFHELSSYYVILNFILSIFSNSTGIEAIQLLNYAHFTFFMPLVFFTVAFTQIKKTTTKKIFWILFFLFLFGFFPISFFENFFSKSLFSSYVHLNTQLCIVFFVLIIINLHELLYKKGNSILKSTIIFFIFFIILYLKKSFAFSIIILINLCFIYFAYLDKVKINKFYSIVILLTINILFIFNYLEAINKYKINFDRENFYFYIHYAKGSWIYMILISVFVHQLGIDRISKNNLFKIKNLISTDFFFSFSLFFSVGIVCLYSLLNSPTKYYGGIHYFIDAFMISIYIYYLIKNEDIIKNFYRNNFIKFLFISLCFIKIFEITNYATKSFLNHTNVSLNQNLNCKSLINENYNDSITRNIIIKSNFVSNVICIRVIRKNLIHKIGLLKNEIKNDPHYIFIQKIQNFLLLNKIDNDKRSKTVFVINMEDLKNLRFDNEKNHTQKNLCNSDYFIIPGILGFGQISLDNMKYIYDNCKFGYVPKAAFKIKRNDVYDFCKVKLNYNLIFVRTEEIKIVQCKNYLKY